VTVLYPFLPAERLTGVDHDRLARAASTVPAFPFSLRSVGRFPGVLYLAPDPTGPFETLLEAVQREWPGLEPYGGRFGSYVPHLTLVEGEEPDGVAAAVAADLPVAAQADALELIVEGRDGQWSTARRYPLGAST
jgi:2'-5' RNA ligase